MRSFIYYCNIIVCLILTINTGRGRFIDSKTNANNLNERPNLFNTLEFLHVVSSNS